MARRRVYRALLVVKASRAAEKWVMDWIDREGQLYRFKRTEKVVSVVVGEWVGR